MILSNPTPDQLSTIATRLWGLVRSSQVPIADGHRRVTVSIGAVLAQDGLPPGAAIARADELLYQSKAKGRDSVTYEFELDRDAA